MPRALISSANGPESVYAGAVSDSSTPAASRTAVIIPCHNEARTIRAVIDDFRRVLPEAAIVVVDNASTDDTATVAASLGATVLRESRLGKGNAVRKALRLVDADAYLMVDGDGTYPAADADRLLQPIREGHADVVTGGRLAAGSGSDFHWLHWLGNKLLLATVNVIFGTRITDLLTGYRAMSREFVRRSPILSGGFELETELTVLALARGFRTVEVPVKVTRRPAGSESKIRIMGDGMRILTSIFTLLRDYRPLTFFGGIGLGSMVAGLALGSLISWEYARTHEVRIPTAILATGLELFGLAMVLTGVMLTTLARRFREIDYQLDGLERDVQRLADQRGPPAGSGAIDRSSRDR